ncbi:MAG: MBL fold metallo-hydrolase [Thermoproteota archaeon]
MRVQFLGTGAAEGWPGLFCECEACNRARALGGKNFRTRSSIHIDESYKVDLPPDTYFHVLRYNLNLVEVKHLFVTHTHYDHLHPDELLMRRMPFAHMRREEPLHIYGNGQALDYVEKVVKDPSKLNLILHSVEPFCTMKVDKLEVMPLLANHSPDQTCLLYLFEINGKTVLHGHDSGWFPEETWSALKNYDLDLVILDCTNGGLPGIDYHMGIEGVLETKRRMVSWHIAKRETIFVATHFSHNGGLLHDQLVSKLLPEGVRVAFDGLTIEL